MAEVVILTVSMGVMKPLLSKLTALLGKEYLRITGVHKKIEFLRDELSTMSATLEMLGDAEQLTVEMRDWRDKLRELAYDIDDYVDTLKDRSDRRLLKGFDGFAARLAELYQQHKFSREMADLKKRAKEISHRHKRYDFVQLASSSHHSSVDPRLPWLYEEIERLVGIDGPKKHIIELLGIGAMQGCSTRRQVVSIVGCGGLGKTTLAKQIYDTVQSHFECAAFVSMSRSPDWGSILRQMAEEVGIKENNSLNGNVQQLINKIRVRLQDKRYFIVIDDVWREQDWNTIMPVLLNNNCMSRIITTTRSVDVANCCSSNQGDYVYKMHPLSYVDSKRLFLTRAFGSEHSCVPHLDDILDMILTKCGGLPLAIITVSSILANKDAVEEWDRVLSAIGSTLSNNPHAESLTTILSLSYFDIPHHLRTCLLYLSVFPEDYEIEKQCLINRWIAEGFIHEEVARTKYEIGEGYFNDLINRSLIQPVNIKCGKAKACRVHDIILDYIKCKAAEENFVTSLDVVKPVCTSSEYKVRRLCVSNYNEENATIWVEQNLSHVRSVTVFGQHVKISLLPSAALRVLDLGGCWGMSDHQVASIGKLFNLRYLRLCSHSITELPKNIGELQHLQTLDLRGTNIEELPPSIMKLQQLAHLYVDDMVRFQNGMIGQMLSLEELGQYVLVSYEQGQSLQEFTKLTKLRTLKMRLDFGLPDGSESKSQAEGFHSCVGNLLSSCNLHNLCIKDISPDTSFSKYPLSLDSWYCDASSSIRKLCIKDCAIYKVPNWMGSLGNLSVLELWVLCVSPEDIEILGKIPCLLFLELYTMGGTNGRIIVHGNIRFRRLKYFSLYMSCCGTSLEFKAGSMPKIEHMKLMFHVHEKYMISPPSLGIKHLSALSKVEIKIRSAGFNIDNKGDAIQCVSRAIEADIKTLPKCSSVRFEIRTGCSCIHFETYLRWWNKDSGGSLTEWLKIWQIREQQSEQATDEKEDET